MSWSFETEPEFQEKLDWMDRFVREEIEPLDVLFYDRSGAAYDPNNALARKLMKPLKEEVRKRGLFACHLTPDLGGHGWGQVKLALMNEILGRSAFAPSIFGCQGPDTGNAELLAHFGSETQKRKYLQPLMDGEIGSCFSMTEPQGGADPKVFKTRAWREGNEYVIEGEKWYSSFANYAEFLLVVAVTNPDVPVYEGASILLVPKGTPGLQIVRSVGTGDEVTGHGNHPYMRFNKVRVPLDNLIGEEGKGFLAAQTRLGGGRVHHAMRTISHVKRAFDMMCERALSRYTAGSQLSEKQSVQEMIADSYIQIKQFRLHVLYTAWLIDKHQSYNREVRKEIAAVKACAEKVLIDVIYRSMHLHGSLGVSNEMPLAKMWLMAPWQGVMDGPNEVHKGVVAKTILRDYKPANGLFPSAHLPTAIDAARRKYAEHLTAEMMRYIANS